MYPFQYLTPEEVILLRKEAIQAERHGKLTDIQLDYIYSKGWFNLFVPKKWGGLEADLLHGLALEEELARTDGSLGWTVTLCSGAAMFVGYFDPQWSSEAFQQQNVCFAGSGRMNGVAHESGKGYYVTGAWGYATGAPHATIFTANCHIYREGIPLFHEDGTPVYKSFCIQQEQVEIVSDWQAMGLKATAGHSFRITDQFIPQKQTFLIQPNHRTINTTLFQYPFMSFAELTTAVNTLGMGLHFLEEVQDIFKTRVAAGKTDESLLIKYRHAVNQITSLRKRFYDQAQLSWVECEQKKELSQTTQQAVRAISQQVVRETRSVVQELFPYCGMHAANEAAEINRIWRDLHTASQHTLLL